jgi:hypothetical protein
MDLLNSACAGDTKAERFQSDVDVLRRRRQQYHIGDAEVGENL